MALVSNPFVAVYVGFLGVPCADVGGSTSLIGWLGKAYAGQGPLAVLFARGHATISSFFFSCKECGFMAPLLGGGDAVVTRLGFQF